MKNAYLDRQNAKKDALIAVAQDVAQQYCVDIFTVVLHRRGYGVERMKAFMKEFMEEHERFLIAFDPKEPEADYYRELLDRELWGVYGDETESFETRYPVAHDIRYDKHVREHKKRR